MKPTDRLVHSSAVVFKNQFWGDFEMTSLVCSSCSRLGFLLRFGEERHKKRASTFPYRGMVKMRHETYET